MHFLRHLPNGSSERERVVRHDLCSSLAKCVRTFPFAHGSYAFINTYEETRYLSSPNSLFRTCSRCPLLPPVAHGSRRLWNRTTSKAVSPRRGGSPLARGRRAGGRAGRRASDWRRSRQLWSLTSAAAFVVECFRVYIVVVVRFACCSCAFPCDRQSPKQRYDRIRARHGCH
jgi:hypothetical protein